MMTNVKQPSTITITINANTFRLSNNTQRTSCARWPATGRSQPQSPRRAQQPLVRESAPQLR